MGRIAAETRVERLGVGWCWRPLSMQDGRRFVLLNDEGYRSNEEDEIEADRAVHYATASGAGVEDGGVGASGTSGVGVSSTPCPLQSGQELRPVVSHWK